MVYSELHGIISIMASKVILTTGANRGIGFSIVQALAQRSSDLTLLVASRSKDNASEAVSQLQGLGLKADFQPIELDVTSDDSIKSAIKEVKAKYGKLDVLINNAGIAGKIAEDNSDFRDTYQKIMNTNVTSVALVSTLFLPLLREAKDPRVVNVSSARGSLTLVTTGKNPPTAFTAYSVSKAALNLLTVEMSHANTDVEFQAVNPGWCKTGFNGFRGPRDPLEGAQSAAELALAPKGQYKAGFWAWENETMEEVPW
ncbi:hypothetical protein PRZ48_000449 [Zasmidium cellare]|uniref:Uncharacterized protein n=1 Tax=Zasmidium cellare TaxID=395010 RepID=A0ABR0EYI8_ZASCE|nr:hypothetical protein PRZ48_000449 [Zasmidium cellare]